MDTMNENCIEFLRNQDRATVTLSQGRFVSRVRKLAEQRPEECRIDAENPDGSIVAHVPVSWVRIQPPKEYELTEEQRKQRAEHMRELRRNQWNTLTKRSNSVENSKEDKKPIEKGKCQNEEGRYCKQFIENLSEIWNDERTD